MRDTKQNKHIFLTRGFDCVMIIYYEQNLIDMKIRECEISMLHLLAYDMNVLDYGNFLLSFFIASLHFCETSY